ncbi:MAG TPA: glycerol-3-phosphate dehydrogenase/oxidase [Acidimicrobiales bacterium]|nr:glycerol-3-phosphate dehydrogenase/oxidase [Acidimicrobiales bacterium]
MTGAAFDRTTSLRRLADETFDVLVIGGGITGAGVALDAASRGLRVALVERGDFASGTSSKSSKLVHGGLRYLQQKEYRLVYENLHERQRLLENAPHLVIPLPFLIPLFGRSGGVNKTVAKAYRTALWLYDITGGLRIGKRHKKVSKAEALHHLPTLNTDLLAAAFLYYDAQADDARLTLTLLRTAADHGAVIANHAPVVEVTKDERGAQVTGAVLSDGTVVRAKCVVNATGVWADDVRALAEGEHPDSIRPAKGIHITVPAAKLPCDIAAVVPVPKDRRSIFVVPWGSHTYLGTTDTDYTGDRDRPECTQDDVRYVLEAINRFITSPLTEDDVTGTWAGLRPLVKNEDKARTADLSRRHKVLVSEEGLVTITGGKLTTYRKMAQDAVDAVGAQLDRKLKRNHTTSMKVRGADGLDHLRREGGDRLGLDDETFQHLVSRYGTDTRTVSAMVAADPTLGEPLVPKLPYLRAEALYAARYEMAHTLEDVLSRRTRALLLERDGAAAAAGDVARLIASELGWDEDEQQRQVDAFVAIADRERIAAQTMPAEPARTV